MPFQPHQRLRYKRPMALHLIAVDSHSPSDRAALVEFVGTHYPEGIPMTEAPILTGKILFFWVLNSHTRIGVTGLMPKTATLVETVKTIVHRDHRGQGHGVTISQLIEDEARRRGYKKVMSTIYTTNLPMIFIKLRQGYRFEGFHPDHEAPGLNEYSFGKLL